MDYKTLDFKTLDAGQEKLLRALLSHCNYFCQSARWNVSESVLRQVQEQVAYDYAALEKATAQARGAGSRPRVTPNKSFVDANAEPFGARRERK